MSVCACGCGDPVMPNRRYVWGHNPGPPKREDVPEWEARDCGHDTPCWVWLKSRNDRGYGRAWDGKQSRGAHLVAWEREFGSVPDGYELDHLCRNRACVRPDHLEVVTHKENMRRGYATTQVTTAGVGGVLRSLRLDAGLSQTDLGDRLSRSGSLVGQWERGELVPPPEMFLRVVRACREES